MQVCVFSGFDVVEQFVNVWVVQCLNNVYLGHDMEDIVLTLFQDLDSNLHLCVEAAGRFDLCKVAFAEGLEDPVMIREGLLFRGAGLQVWLHHYLSLLLVTCLRSSVTAPTHKTRSKTKAGLGGELIAKIPRSKKIRDISIKKYPHIMLQGHKE